MAVRLARLPLPLLLLLWAAASLATLCAAYQGESGFMRTLRASRLVEPGTAAAPEPEAEVAEAAEPDGPLPGGASARTLSVVRVVRTFPSDRHAFVQGLAVMPSSPAAGSTDLQVLLCGLRRRGG